MNRSRSRRVRSLIRAGILLLLCTVTLPVLPYLWVSASDDITSSDTVQINPRANFWRDVRAGARGYSAVSGPEANVLIKNEGQNWRQFRMSLLAPYGSYLMGAVFITIAAFYALRGPVQHPSNESKKLLQRFSVYQRVVHWFTAILFWILALTGLILLYGRFVLIPLFGSSGFALTASASKEAHNLFGPVFMVALCMLIIEYARDNFYRKGDFSWLANGGGLLGRHASAGRFNFGEKIWFWLVLLLGSVLSLSGIVLDFANLNFARGTLELAHVFHGIAAIVFISISFGHVYLGTIGTRGTLRGMTTGYVEQTWAELHHDRWQPDDEMTPEAGPLPAAQNE